MRETINDPYALKRLQMENKRLKESLELEKEKYSVACDLLSFFMPPEEEFEKICKAVDMLRDKVEEVKGENKALKEENMSLKEYRQEGRRLEAVIRDYEEKIFILTRGQSWEKAVVQNILKSYRVSAQILCYAIEGNAVKDIIKKLSQDGGISVSTRRVNRVLSVKEDKDLLRIHAVFHQFPDAFREHGISDEDMLEWFSEARIRKLKLMSKNEAEEHFGRDSLEDMKPDPYVSGEFYDVRGMEGVRNG